MFIVLIGRTRTSREYSNSYEALSSKNEWPLSFTDDLVIFSHFKVSCVYPERAAILKNLTSETRAVPPVNLSRLQMIDTAENN